MARMISSGVTLNYAQAGAGDPAFVFVHGWCSDLTFFEPQFEHFKSSHQVVALDLRGCGRSDRPEGGYDIPTLADDVAGFCRELRLARPVIVGHSLGGMIAIELAARHPTLPLAIAAVDPGPIGIQPDSVAVFERLIAELEGPEPRGFQRAFVDGMFLPTDDVEIRRRITDAMCSAPLAPAIAMVRGVVRWDGLEALQLCSAPLLVLLSETDGSNRPERLRELKPTIQIGVTVGAGHFHQLEVPEQVTPMIERFVRTLPPQGAMTPRRP